ncbi:MAG: DUF2442 domain-containing protein [Bacteroidales bacterium]|jgi:hypothetical protein|nr:DUF2442 domain-containing protein [Bacteroidales bacterium]
MTQTTFLEVKNVEFLKNYNVKLQFSTGETKIVDLEPDLSGEVFEPLKDPVFFRQGKIIYNTVEWPNGADFAPEYLLAKSSTIRY